MKRKIFITGSTDGLGYMIAERLLRLGRDVLVHARNDEKAEMVLRKLPGAMGAVTGDLSSIRQTKSLAAMVNEYGPFDSIIHNAAVGFKESYHQTEDKLPHVFAINSLAPYLLTCLIDAPGRLIYTSSGLHKSGDPDLSDMLWQKKAWNGVQAYSDTKLQNVLLGFAVARLWPHVITNVVTPGWVATKMGGEGAPDDLDQAPETQIWLASSDAPEVKVSGKYFYHKAYERYLPEADNIVLQEEFIDKCSSLTGITLTRQISSQIGPG